MCGTYHTQTTKDMDALEETKHRGIELLLEAIEAGGEALESQDGLLQATVVYLGSDGRLHLLPVVAQRARVIVLAPCTAAQHSRVKPRTTMHERNIRNIARISINHEKSWGRLRTFAIWIVRNT